MLKTTATALAALGGPALIGPASADIKPCEPEFETEYGGGGGDCRR